MRHDKPIRIEAATYEQAAEVAGVGKQSKTYKALRDVMVKGMRPLDASIKWNVSRQTVHEAAVRVRHVLLGGGVCPLCLQARH